MKKLFSLFDCKGHLYSVPVESANLATAKRLFAAQVRRADFPLSDFQVLEVGSFDEQTGKIDYLPGSCDTLGGDE